MVVTESLPLSDAGNAAGGKKLEEVTLVCTDVEGSTELWEWCAKRTCMWLVWTIENHGFAVSNPSFLTPPSHASLLPEAQKDPAVVAPRDGEVMTEAQELHDQIMRSLISRYCGHEVTTEGDSFIVSFHNALDAAAWVGAHPAIVSKPITHCLWVLWGVGLVGSGTRLSGVVAASCRTCDGGRLHR